MGTEAGKTTIRVTVLPDFAEFDREFRAKMESYRQMAERMLQFKVGASGGVTSGSSFNLPPIPAMPEAPGATEKLTAAADRMRHAAERLVQSNTTGASSSQLGGPPPIPDGMVRFYHGGNAYAGGPRWLTPDRAYAEGYAYKNASEKAFTQYVDIRSDSPHLQKAFDDSGSDVKSPYRSFNAPEDIARNLRPLGSMLALPAPQRQINSVSQATPDYIAERAAELISGTVKRSSRARGTTSRRTLPSSSISDIFGIEYSESIEDPYSASPRSSGQRLGGSRSSGLIRSSGNVINIPGAVGQRMLPGQGPSYPSGGGYQAGYSGSAGSYSGGRGWGGGNYPPIGGSSLGAFFPKPPGSGKMGGLGLPSQGTYFAAVFGLWEVAQADSAVRRGQLEAKYANTNLEALSAQVKANQAASSGILGSTVSLFGNIIGRAGGFYSQEKAEADTMAEVKRDERLQATGAMFRQNKNATELLMLGADSPVLGLISSRQAANEKIFQSVQQRGNLKEQQGRMTTPGLLMSLASYGTTGTVPLNTPALSDAERADVQRQINELTKNENLVRQGSGQEYETFIRTTQTQSELMNTFANAGSVLQTQRSQMTARHTREMANLRRWASDESMSLDPERIARANNIVRTREGANAAELAGNQRQIDLTETYPVRSSQEQFAAENMRIRQGNSIAAARRLYADSLQQQIDGSTGPLRDTLLKQQQGRLDNFDIQSTRDTQAMVQNSRRSIDSMRARLDYRNADAAKLDIENQYQIVRENGQITSVNGLRRPDGGPPQDTDRFNAALGQFDAATDAAGKFAARQASFTTFGNNINAIGNRLSFLGENDEAAKARINAEREMQLRTVDGSLPNAGGLRNSINANADSQIGLVEQGGRFRRFGRASTGRQLDYALAGMDTSANAQGIVDDALLEAARNPLSERQDIFGNAKKRIDLFGQQGSFQEVNPFAIAGQGGENFSPQNFKDALNDANVGAIQGGLSGPNGTLDPASITGGVTLSQLSQNLTDVLKQIKDLL